VNEGARDLLDPRGVRAHAAFIAGVLDLSFVAVPFSLALRRCALSDYLNLSFIEIPSVDLTGACLPSLNAEHATVKGTVSLRSLRSKGPINLRGALIGGTLDCTGGKFQNPTRVDVAGSGTALNVEQAKVAGGVLLRNGFIAAGSVWLYGAAIGALDCDGGKFHNPDGAEVQGARAALTLERANVVGSVYLRYGFFAEGMVRLYGSEIGGNLECDGGKFHNPAPRDRRKRNRDRGCDDESGRSHSSPKRVYRRGTGATTQRERRS
jgi:cytoskeletal protein CcmA (bactofilin family)